MTDVTSDYQLGAPELVDPPDRARATDVGVSVQDIANTVSALVGGAVVGQYSNGGRRMDINMRLTSTQRSRPEDLSMLRVRAANGTLVPLSSVVMTKQVAELQADQPRRPGARHHDPRATSAPGHAQGDAVAYVQALASETAARLPHRARRAELAVRRRDEQPDLRAHRRASWSRTWCSRRSSTRSCIR